MPYNKDADEYYSKPTPEAVADQAILAKLYAGMSAAIATLFKIPMLGNMALDSIYNMAVALPDCVALVDYYKASSENLRIQQVSKHWINHEVSKQLKNYINSK